VRGVTSADVLNERRRLLFVDMSSSILMTMELNETKRTKNWKDHVKATINENFCVSCTDAYSLSRKLRRESGE